MSKLDFNSKEISILSQMIKNSIFKKIGPEIANKFINDINKKESDNMSALEIFLEKLIDESIEKGLKQGIEKGIEKGIKKGIEQSRNNIVLQMLKNKIDDKTIILITEIDKNELAKIKQSIF